MKRGDRLGPYEILDLLGRGAMGEVYLARHPELGHHYAVKILSAAYSEDPLIQERFQREMASLAQVGGHPGIVRVHSGGWTPDRRAFYAMEYVQGISLKQALKEGKLTHAQKLYAVECVADALAWAHERGVVHRDVKPDNVLISADGVTRLTDFGLALSNADMNQRLTMAGDMVGTPAYMAPEQVAPDLAEVGPWTDVFALGAILYEILAGAPPYLAKTSMEVYTKLMEGAPIPPPSEVESSVEKVIDLETEEVCLKALSRLPQERYADASGVRDALRALREGPGPQTRGTPRGLIYAALASVALCVLVIGAVLIRKPTVDDAVGPEQLQRLVSTGQLDEAWSAGRELLAAGHDELAPLVGEAGRKLVEAAWRERDADAVRAVLEVGARLEAFDEQAFLVAVVLGDPAAALALEQSLEPEEAAHYAAWAGDRARLEAALAALPDDARRRGLAWSLRPFVPDLSPPRGSLRPGSQLWGALAAAEECLGRGLLGGARRAAAEARQDARTNRERLAASLTSARVALADGDLEACAGFVEQAWERSETPLEEALCAGWAVRLAQLSALNQALSDRLGSDPLPRLTRLYPGLPACREREEALGSGLTAVARARRDPALRAALAERVGAVARGSWLELERELCLRGLDGPVGLCLAEGALLAEAAERGFEPGDADPALQRLARVAPLRPRSVLLRAAQARAALVAAGEDLVDAALQRARESSARAIALSAEDPAALLLHARVAWAGAVPAQRAADEARLGERGEPDQALDAAAAEASAAAARAYHTLAGLKTTHPARAWGRLGAARAELVSARYRSHHESFEALLPDLQRIASSLTELVPDEQVSRLDDARQQAAAKLATGDWSQAGDAFCRLTAEVDPERLDVTVAALRLLASLGLPETSERAARAYLGLAGDVPAHALLVLRSAERRSGPAALQLSARARTLAPHVPEVLLEQRCREIDAQLGFASSAEAYLDLAQVVLEAPERAPAVVALLSALSRSEVDPADFEEALRVQQPARRATAHLALALWGLRREESSAALEAAAQASEALASSPRAREGARLLRALAYARVRPANAMWTEAAREDLRAVSSASPSNAAVAWLQLELGGDQRQRQAADALLGHGFVQDPSLLALERAGLSEDLRAWLIKTVRGDDFHLTNSGDSLGLAWRLLESVTDRSGRPRLPRLVLGLRLEAGQRGPDELDAGLEELYVVLPQGLRDRARVLHGSGAWFGWGARDADWGDRRELAALASRALHLRSARPETGPGGFVGWRARTRAPERYRVEDAALPPYGALDEVWARLEVEAPLVLALASAWAERPGEKAGWAFDAEHLFEPWDWGQALLTGVRDPRVSELAVDWLADERLWGEGILALARSAAFSVREAHDEVLLEQGFDEFHDELGEVAEDLPERRESVLELLHRLVGLSHWGEGLATHPGRAMGFRVMRAGALLNLATLEPALRDQHLAAARREVAGFDFSDELRDWAAHADEWEHYGRWYRVRSAAASADPELERVGQAFASWFEEAGGDRRRRVRGMLREDLELDRLREEPALRGMFEALRLDDEDDEGRRRR